MRTKNLPIFAFMKAPRNLEKYLPDYDAQRFWKKMRRTFRRHFLPAFGFTDDIAALTYAVYKVINCVTPLVKDQAEAKVYEWFGDVDQSDLIL